MERDPELLSERIHWLKKRRNAVILAHNYQLGEVQEIADHVGDSLDLAEIARDAEEDVVVFCGVHFMAETAHILAPEKTILLPEKTAGCALANMGNADELRERRKMNPDLVVVCYINSTAEIKALSDFCCTSANAESIIESIPEGREILFVPDRYLGGHVGLKLGRPISVATGYCPSHARMTMKDVVRKRREYPGAKLMVHPESRREVAEAADIVTGTGGMLRYVRSPECESVDTFLVGTEPGLVKRLEKENPGKRFVVVSEDAVCPDMKRTTMESILESLEKNVHVVTLPDELREEAFESVDRMFRTCKRRENRRKDHNV